MANKYENGGRVDKGELQAVNNILDQGLVMRDKRNYQAMYKHFTDAIENRPQEICFYLYAIQAMVDGKLDSDISALTQQAAAVINQKPTKPITGKPLEIALALGHKLFEQKNFTTAADFLEIIHAHAAKKSVTGDTANLELILAKAAACRKKSRAEQPEWLAAALQQAGTLTP